MNQAFTKTQIKLEKEKKIIQSLLCCAIEGGSNYWYCIDDHNLSEFPSGTFVSSMLAELGSVMTISDSSGEEAFKPKTVTHLDVLKAMEIFKKDSKYKVHYDNAMNDNSDADTGDVFFQLLVFGRVIFG